MNMIKGKYYLPSRSKYINATLKLTAHDHFEIYSQGEKVASGLVDELKISNRLANTERKIKLKDNSTFATKNNDAVDQLFKHKTRASIILHRAEKRASFAVASVVFIALLGLGFFKWGIPALSQKIAYMIPKSVENSIGKKSMTLLDKYMLEPTTIDSKRQAKIKRYFQQKILSIIRKDSDVEYKIHFRSMDDIPNALALPSGDIILTDKFLQLTDDLDEIGSVLLHEVGHVAHHHTMQSIISNSFVAISSAIIFGDTNSIVDISAGAITAMVNSKFSRDKESEADLFAFKHMLNANRDPAACSRVMSKIEEYMQHEYPGGRSETNSTIANFYASHPNTKDRIKMAKRYSKCFKSGDKICKKGRDEDI